MRDFRGGRLRGRAGRGGGLGPRPVTSRPSRGRCRRGSMRSRTRWYPPSWRSTPAGWNFTIPGTKVMSSTSCCAVNFRPPRPTPGSAATAPIGCGCTTTGYCHLGPRPACRLTSCTSTTWFRTGSTRAKRSRTTSSGAGCGPSRRSPSATVRVTWRWRRTSGGSISSPMGRARPRSGPVRGRSAMPSSRTGRLARVGRRRCGLLWIDQRAAVLARGRGLGVAAELELSELVCGVQIAALRRRRPAAG